MHVGRLEELPQLPPLDARIPQWCESDLVERSCPFCSSVSPPLLLRPDRLPVAYCETCGCWYVALAPKPEALSRFYDAYYQLWHPRDLSARRARKMKLRAAWDAEDDLRIQELSSILGSLQGRRILEVGCGLGYLLLEMRACGAEVLGTEVNAEAQHFVRDRLGIPVLCGDEHECIQRAGRFDVVVMSDLIEHPLEPLALLSAAVRGLVPGGLLVLWTPNGGAAGQTAQTGAQWVGFRVDLEHMQYLSGNTIAFLAARLGLKVEHLETLGFPALEGIDRLPTSRSVAKRIKLRELIFWLLTSRGLRRGLAIARAVSRCLSGVPNPRLGNYHLFAILRVP